MHKNKPDAHEEDLAWNGKPPSNPYLPSDPRHEAWFYGLEPDPHQPSEAKPQLLGKSSKPPASLDGLFSPQKHQMPDWREILQDRTLIDKPCFIVLLKPGAIILEESHEALAGKLSRMRGIPTHEKKEHYLVLACHCRKTPKQSLFEVLEALKTAADALYKEKKRLRQDHSYATRDYLSEAFRELFRDIKCDNIADSLELPRRPIKYADETSTGLDPVLANTPLAPNVCEGCRQKIPDCRCHLYHSSRKV